MTHKITEDCVTCGACVSECPTNAISEGPDRYVIDANTCTDCATCVDACPAGAIVPGK
ncbi:MAG: 4Fe-4S binding protein [Oligoflexia bacterium]|nr:4Fe-4S binding protein [Oligoflexia bacterium]MBF0366828.1 4Fe-4S binding protein [Oligoflexia bacterium]